MKLLRQDLNWRVVENEVEGTVRKQIMSVLEVLLRILLKLEAIGEF